MRSHINYLTYRELVRSHGDALAQLCLAYGWHHHDERGRPVWVDCGDEVVALAEYELARRRGGA
ncbi:MAG: hypothetical protein JO161_05350 [Planctomycetaceae bacterium]|nr:hypothetical protein [Planctomycetaceae bacterium]